MKILFVGQIAVGQTSRMRMEALQDLGNTVISVNSSIVWTNVSWLSRWSQSKLGVGPSISKLNRSVISLARQCHPDLLWAEKQEYLDPGTLETLHKLGTKLLHYTPDPYFTLTWKRTRLMDTCMPLFDFVVTSKQYELTEYRKRCQRVFYMPLGYAENVHRPILPRDKHTKVLFASDVSFVGGWEPRREVLLDTVVSNTDCMLKVWGYAWDHLIDGRWTIRRAYHLSQLAGKASFCIRKNSRLMSAIQGGEIYDDRYAWALTGSRIGIGFLRKVWPDQHTTRTFEIPACASMMIADRTDEHRAFFEEGKEAEFFSSSEELVDKLRFYLNNEESRKRVAWRGYERCLQSGYSYRERLKGVLSELV